MSIIKLCPNCGSSSIARDAFARWDVNSQQWVVGDVYDREIWCQECEETISVPVDLETEPTPVVHITTPFADIEVPISELDVYQRNALAELLGLRSAKAEAFKALSTLKPFQKIKKTDLQKLCPHKVPFDDMSVQLTSTDRQPEGKAAVEQIWKFMPEAECSPMLHTLSVYCKECNATHSMSKHSVLVRMVVAGVPFNKLYEV